MSPPTTAAARRTLRRGVQGHANVPRPSAPRIAPRGPRRVSGPAPQPVRRSGAAPTRGARILTWLRALPDHRMTDRLVRGRAWIVVVGFLLIGIVAMQVTLLKLNSGIGRAVAQSANFERRNGELRAAVSRLSAEQRLQAMGAKLGLIAPDASRVSYLHSHGSRDAVAAAQALRANQQPAVTSATTAGPAQGDGSSAAPDSAAGGDQSATSVAPAAPESAAAGAIAAPGR